MKTFLVLFGSFLFSVILPAQTFKAGDVVYFKATKVEVDGRYYFSSPVYVIATVRKVVGSNAILDTDLYLYKCRKDDSYWQTGTKLSIAKRFGVGHVYTTWRTSQNKGYTWSTRSIKHYTSKVEQQLTGGKIRRAAKDCSVFAHT